MRWGGTVALKLTKCPLCDPYQHRVYAAVRRTTVPEEYEVYLSTNRGEWIECPLCFSTGEVAAELAAAFYLTRGKLSPMVDSRPHYSDLVLLRNQIFELLRKDIEID
jgi:hypothetical protein